MAQTKNISAAFSHQGREISYTLCFDRFKTVRLRMKESGRLEIKAPFHTPLTAIENSMRKHAEWIFAGQEQFAGMQAAIKPVTEEVFIFGKAFCVKLRKTNSAPLEKIRFFARNSHIDQEELFSRALPILQNSRPEIRLTDQEISIHCPNNEEALKLLILWRKKTAQRFLSLHYSLLWKVFQEKTAHFLLRHTITTPYHFSCPPLAVRSCKRCFGSCRISAKEQKTRITLSRHLMGLPLEYIEFVILHEFCHLIYPDHSPRFYALFSAVLPNHKSLKSGISHWSKRHNSF